MLASTEANLLSQEVFQGIAFNETDITLKARETYTLTLLYDISNQQDKVEIQWQSSNPAVVTVDDQGVIKARARGTAMITATVDEQTAVCNVTVRFSDVDEKAYYYDAVCWATEKAITSGITEADFAPEQTCTRAQAVTFLWRANGSPAFNGAIPFKDVIYQFDINNIS